MGYEKIKENLELIAKSGILVTYNDEKDIFDFKRIKNNGNFLKGDSDAISFFDASMSSLVLKILREEPDRKNNEKSIKYNIRKFIEDINTQLWSTDV